MEEATDGLPPQEAIEHLESTVAAAEAEASRLGLAISSPVGADSSSLEDADSPVVVIKQMVDAN